MDRTNADRSFCSSRFYCWMISSFLLRYSYTFNGMKWCFVEHIVMLSLKFHGKKPVHEIECGIWASFVRPNAMEMALIERNNGRKNVLIWMPSHRSRMEEIPKTFLSRHYCQMVFARTINDGRNSRELNDCNNNKNRWVNKQTAWPAPATAVATNSSFFFVGNIFLSFRRLSSIVGPVRTAI